MHALDRFAQSPDCACGGCRDAGPSVHFTIMEKMHATAAKAYSKAAGKWPRPEDPLVPAYAAVRDRLARIRAMKGLPETEVNSRHDHEIALKAAADAAYWWGSRTT